MQSEVTYYYKFFVVEEFTAPQTCQLCYISY